MKKMILKMGIQILRIVYAPFQLLKVKNKVSYMSRQSDSISLDFELIVSEMKAKYPETENVVLTRMVTGGKKSIVTYPFHMLRQMYHLSTSKVVIIDGYCIVVSLLPHKKETKVIQIWHAAAAIKKFGYQTLDQFSGSSSDIAKIMRMHRNYDYVLASSEETGKQYCEAFNINADKIAYVGMPHFSQLKLFGKSEEMDKTYPQLKEKKNILYIPTFRKGKNVQLEELIEGIDFEKYNLIARLHPLDKPQKEDERVIFDSLFTVYDWIKKSDIVIADYSSLIIECAILEKQMYFYLYDLDDYAQDPGMNVDFLNEELEDLIFVKGSELGQLLEKKYDMDSLIRFKNKYVEVDVDNSLQKVVELIRKIM